MYNIQIENLTTYRGAACLSSGGLARVEIARGTSEFTLSFFGPKYVKSLDP